MLDKVSRVITFSMQNFDLKVNICTVLYKCVYLIKDLNTSSTSAYNSKVKNKPSSKFHFEFSTCFPAHWPSPRTGACVWGSTTWTPPWTSPQQRNALRWTVSSATRGSCTSRIAPTSPTTSPWCIWPRLWTWRRRSAQSVCPNPGLWCPLGRPAMWPAGATRKVQSDDLADFFYPKQWLQSTMSIHNQNSKNNESTQASNLLKFLF